MSANTLQYQSSIANWIIDDPGASGAIGVNRSGTVEIVTAGAETRTIAVPTKSDIELALVMKTDGGDCTITVASAYTELGDTTIVFANAGEYVVLRSFQVAVGTFAWRLVAADPVERLNVGTVTATTITSTNTTATSQIQGAVVNMSSGTITQGLQFASAGAYSQGTNISTAVAITTNAGMITTQAASTAAAAEEAFAVTNAGIVAATDLVFVDAKYNGTTGTGIVYVQDKADGSFTVGISNVHASEALNGTFDIGYMIVHIVTE